MCCYNDPKAAKALQAKMRAKGGTMRFWKVRLRTDDGLKAPYGHGVISSPGPLVARHESGGCVRRALCQNHSLITDGIHVFCDRATAMLATAYFLGERAVVVAVRCEADDLIGQDWYWSAAVFRKVTVTPQAFARAMSA